MKIEVFESIRKTLEHSLNKYTEDNRIIIGSKGKEFDFGTIRDFVFDNKKAKDYGFIFVFEKESIYISIEDIDYIKELEIDNTQTE